jgi:predicted DNA-binding transcriptional regulator YafY
VQALRPSCLENDYDYLAKIQTAIVSKNILRLQYENAAQEASYREVEPIGLIFYSLNWHLIGWCWKREEYRDFRVSRIQKLVSTTDPFRKSDHIALSEYQVDVYKW